MKIKSVVFDWDGTLADTIPLIKKAYDTAFEAVGMEKMSYDQIKELAGKFSNRNIFQTVFGEDMAATAKTAFYDFIDKNHLKYLTPFDGAEDILKYCEKNKISCHILTNKNRRYLDSEIKQLGWNKYFDRILGAGEREHDKPHPDICMALFDNTPPPAEEMIVLGDGDADIAMAQVWKCPSVIFDEKGTYKGRPADYHIKHLQEFITLIKHWE